MRKYILLLGSILRTTAFTGVGLSVFILGGGTLIGYSVSGSLYSGFRMALGLYIISLHLAFLCISVLKSVNRFETTFVSSCAAGGFAAFLSFLVLRLLWLLILPRSDWHVSEAWLGQPFLHVAFSVIGAVVGGTTYYSHQHGKDLKR